MAKNNTVEKRNSILGMSFFGPALVLMAIFLFIPMILTLVFSFTDYFALNPSLTSFVGLDNYVALFKDRLFVQAFGNTILFVIKQGNLIHPLTIEARNFLIMQEK